MIINNNNKIVSPASQSRDSSDKSAGMDVKLLKNKESNPVKKGDTDKLKEKRKAEALINRYMNRTIRMEVDNELHRVIIKLIDKKSGEIIQQIPPEDLIELAKKLRSGEGIFLDKEV
ncbi:MAG TPA: flagellar protein FlaG [Nitrospirae bacterium]|nr:flagellar protein FlaG [Nitrospirota bacterium]